jgi:hypothetical protein
MLKYIITAMVALCAASQMSAQGHWCGTTGEHAQQVEQRLIANKEALRNGLITARQETQYIPVTFHLIARTNGEDRVGIGKVLDQLCALNDDFEPVGFQFYLHDGTFNYINSTTAYENHLQVQNSVLNSERDFSAVNIFIPESANFNDDGEGTVLGYFNPSSDWLVVSKNEVSASSSTVPHELGHFFSLLHPFNGWDPSPWSEEDHGNPVTQTTAPNGFTAVELVDGSNCETAGDRVCDTPANYYFGLGWPDCEFDELVYDRNNDLLEPEEALFMDYFLNCSRSSYFFSDDQMDLMQADYESAGRSYIRSNYVSNQTVIEDTPDLIEPTVGEVFGRYNDIEFEWSSVTGATSYLLQVSTNPTFSSNIFEGVVNGTSQTVELLQPSRLHFWRVRPFNEYSTCTDYTSFGTFTTGAITNTQEAVLAETFTLHPNPLQAGQSLQVQLSANEAFRATFTLYNTVGQAVQALGQHDVAVGQHTLALPAPQALSPGLYLLEMRKGQRRQFAKLIVAQ